MSRAPTEVVTLLEIGRKPSGEIPASLIRAAYRASHSRPVMLVLDSVSPREVDLLLDPVVARSGRNHRGVMYASLRNEGEVLNVAAAASRVFAASQTFRAKLASRGIKFSDVSEAEPVLCIEERESA
jgi:hypothetical protein